MELCVGLESQLRQMCYCETFPLERISSVTFVYIYAYINIDVDLRIGLQENLMVKLGLN